jgi:hypothetical protein
MYSVLVLLYNNPRRHKLDTVLSAIPISPLDKPVNGKSKNPHLPFPQRQRWAFILLDL